MSKQDTESQSQTPKTEVDVWQFVRDDAVKVQAKEPALSAFLDGVVLSHDSLESVVAFHLGAKLGNGELGSETLSQLFLQAFQSGPAISAAMRADVIAIVERDPACQSYLDPVLYYKGFLVLQAYRGAHFLIEMIAERWLYISKTVHRRCSRLTCIRQLSSVRVYLWTIQRAL